MKLFDRWLAHSFDWQSLGLALLIVVVSFLLIRGVVRGIFHFIEKRIPKRFEAWIDVLMAFENPARVVVLFSGLLLALHTAHAPHLLITFATQVYRSILIFSIGYGLYTLMGSLTTLLAHLGERVHMEIDSIVMPFLTRILQFVVMALTVTMILSDWGINVNGVFAGLGLVGLAVSMAAQDPIKNLLGGIIIITEKPFQIGDWIASPSVEGI
ncbi:MAG: mechanosensitive ion channel family protein, partial [Weissella cibaria]